MTIDFFHFGHGCGRISHVGASAGLCVLLDARRLIAQDVKMINIRKSMLGASLALASSVPAFAQGTAPTMDTTAAEGAVSALQTGITSLINNSIIPAVVVIILAFAGLWGVQLVWRKIRSNKS